MPSGPIDARSYKVELQRIIQELSDHVPKLSSKVLEKTIRPSNVTVGGDANNWWLYFIKDPRRKH